MSKPILFFDFDGVIVHSLDMWFEIAKRDHPWATREMWQEMARGNIHTAFEAMSAELHSEKQNMGGAHGLIEEEIMKKLTEQRLTDGIAAALFECTKMADLFIVTSGKSNVVRHFLEFHGLDVHFVDIYGSDHDICKEKKIRMIFERTGCVAGECLFITDTLGDLREANRAEVPGIAVTWGHHDKVDLRKGDPIAMVDTVEELMGVIKERLEKSALGA
jgi:phosphoglycolate phosphatase